MKLRVPSHFRSAVLITAVMLFICSTPLFSGELGRLPRSALPGVRSIDTVERHEMPWFDVEALRAEDARRESSGKPVAPRVGKVLEVDFSPDNSGTWEVLEDGSRLWRIRISSPGALSLSLGLKRFDPPEGAMFWVHAADGSGVQGPYTKINRNARGGLSTAVVLGDELVAELHLPKGSEANLVIQSVNHGYRGFGERKAEYSEKRGWCNINVVCPQGDPWRDQIRSVAQIETHDNIYIYGCTAQLVNNTAEDLTPYLLTAGHCFDPEISHTLVAYWNYQTSACDDATGGNLSQNQSGASFIASWYEGTDIAYYGGSDFMLLELDQQPQPSFNVYYSGWDARDIIPNATTTIHHPAYPPDPPSPSEKSISSDYDPPTITSRLGDLSPGDGLFLRVADWDEGTTEVGSSGGCLFDNATKRCVGNLSGGWAACDYNDFYTPPIGPDEPDWYGRMHAHWTGDGTPETRLSDWLDPLGGNTLFLDGKNGTGVGTQESWLVPAVASRTGASSTDWKSQIGVVNPTAETRSASVYFVATDQAWPGELLSGPHTIEANESLYLDDVLQPERPASGLLYVTVSGTGTAVFCRTFTPAPEGGSFGQGQPGILLSSASSENELILPLIHSAPGVFRTNVGFAQTSTGTYQVRVEIYSAAGVLLAQTSYSQSSAWRQVNNIFNNMGIGSAEVEGGWIRVTLTSGSPSFWTTYATVIDDPTGDPTYVLPVAP
jgi:hypothetical protein